MPTAGLDESWMYALNVAVENHLRFGSEIVFTFGPLASVYTRLYTPGTDALMLSASALMSAAILIGFAALTHPSRVFWLVLLPLVISLVRWQDALFITTPLLLLPLAERASEDAVSRLALFFVAVACGLLLLVKGSFIASVCFCTCLAAAIRWPESRSDAVKLIAIVIAATASGWIASGQRLEDLPNFFLAQVLIIAGYTEGMEYSGPVVQIVVYVASAVLVLWTLWRTVEIARWRFTIAAAAILFLCFKAAFVRHGPGVTAPSGLTLVALIAALRWPSPRTTLALAVAASAWLLVAVAGGAINKADVLDTVVRATVEPAQGLVRRLQRSGALDADYRDARARIAHQIPMPRPDATADLYPAELGALLAADARWSPRPVFQSYSAYTPRLARLNQEHLRSAGADRIYFRIDPIDGHHPALEDAASWPELLSMYEPLHYQGQYVVLARKAMPSPVDPAPLSSIILAKVKDEVPLPFDAVVWAEIDLTPTWLGRLVSLVYKLPELSIVVRHADKNVAAYRFIPGMASTGFVISPTVSSAQEFVALATQFPTEVLADRRVTSFRIVGGVGTRWLWKRDYRARFSTLNTPTSPRAESLVFSQGKSVGSLDLPAGGECNIELINGKPASTGTFKLGSNVMRVSGWAMISTERAAENVAVDVAVGGSGAWVFSAQKKPRPDVAQYFRQPSLGNVGFEAVIDTSKLGPNFKLRLVQTTSAGHELVCGDVSVAR